MFMASACPEGTRSRVGALPADSNAALHGTISNLVKNPDGSGSFDLGTILVRYVAATSFAGTTRDDLANGDFCEATGFLRITGDELDADEFELESQGLGSGSAAEAGIEGVVSNRVSIFIFDVAGTSVDATNATFEPAGLVVMDGAFVEVEGRLESGVLIAENVSSGDETEAQQNVVIEAAVTMLDVASRTLTILGVTVVADGQTKIEDNRDDDENFRFGEIQPADWLEIERIQTGPPHPTRGRRDRRSLRRACQLPRRPLSGARHSRTIPPDRFRNTLFRFC